MPNHFTIANFKFGLDSRRSELTSVPGTLLKAENGHINQGAQFEKRKAFVKLGQLPVGCFSLQETVNGLITYGSAVAPDLSVFNGLISYSRIRHPYWQLDQVAPTIAPHLNPNSLIEPSLSGIVHSCTFGGKDFVIASYTAEEGNGFDTFDDYFSGTFYYYDGAVVLNCLQGRLDFPSSIYSGGAASNYYPAKFFVYYAQQSLGQTFTFSFGATGASDVSVAITGPINSSFSLVVSDTTNGQLVTSTQTAATAEVTGVGATATVYLTQALAGSKSVDSLNAPNVVNGVLSGTVDLLNGVAVPFNTSLFQTATDLATKINSNSATTGYTAQANYQGTNVTSVTITSPVNFGAVVNGQNISISTTNIKTSSTSLAKSGATGAQTYELAGGVTAVAGQSQVQKLTFNVPVYPLGNYQADLVFNTVTYTLGRGNLTTKRATTVFYLISGSGGSINSITYKDGTNLLSAAVPFNNSLLQTCKDVISNIVAKWNTTVGQFRYSSGGGSPVLRNENIWLAYLTSVVNSNGDTVYGIAIVAPEGDKYNGTNNLVISNTTLEIDTSAEGVGFTTLTLSMSGAVVDGTFLSALGGKLYLARGKQFNFSSSYDCTKWENQDTGAGVIPNMDLYTAPTDVVAMCPYQGKMSVFSRYNISIWQVNADPAQYAQSQSLTNIGTFARLSVQPLGDLDVLFLSDTGVRSLRVRDNTLNAFVNDIGSPIDEFIIASLLSNTSNNNASACAIVEPASGRYWLHLNGTIYVLSYYPSLKIIAWSTYLPTYDDGSGNQVAFTPVKFLSFQGLVYVLDSNNNVYVYGGTNGNTYDGCVATVQSPWMDLKSPNMEKNSLRLNVAMAGEWQVQASMDPRANDLMVVVPSNDLATGSEPSDSTFDEGSFVWSRRGTHFQFLASTLSSWKQAASFSAMTLQYNPGRDA